MLGTSISNVHIHVVVGIGKDGVQIITAYIPTLDVWEDDFKTRKTVKK